MVLKINITYGSAGTGKTYQLTELVKKLDKTKQSYIILAPTHNALNNIHKKLNNESKYVNKLKTLHAYFRIDYKNDNRMLGPMCIYNNIIIDEFSLMHRDIYTQILKILKGINNSITLHMFGDPLQLNAVYNNIYDNIITFNDLILYEKLFDKHMQKRMSAYTIKHFHQSIFYNNPLLDSDDVTYKQLETNYRSNDNVMLTINALRNNDTSFNYKFTRQGELLNLLNKPEYYFIASNYEILQEIYDNLRLAFSSNTGYRVIKQSKLDKNDTNYFKTLYVYTGCKLRVLETTDNLMNGQLLTYVNTIDKVIICKNDETNEEIHIKKNEQNIYPLGPHNLFTVHKSQGYTLKNVIVCYNKMFEISMLYTAVTRASEILSFYSHREEPNANTLVNTMHSDELNDLNKLSNIIVNAK